MGDCIPAHTPLCVQALGLQVCDSEHRFLLRFYSLLFSHSFTSMSGGNPEVAPSTLKKRKVNDTQMTSLDNGDDEEGPVAPGHQDEVEQG